MAITLDGTLGITSPAETIQGPLTTTGNTILGDASTDTLNVGNGGLVKDASGNVGIGTASPSWKIDLVTSGTSGIRASTADYGMIQLTNGTVVTKMQNGGTVGILGTDTNHSLAIQTNNTERMRIDSSGNVAIGTTTNTSKLYIQTAGTAVNALEIYSPSTTIGAKLQFSDNNYNAYISSIPASSTTNLAFGVAGAERMRIDSSGNVLVGTTSATGVSTLTSGVVAGIYVTATGSISTTSAVATTIFTVPAAPAGLYLVNISLSNQVPSLYNSIAYISVGNTTLRATSIATATNSSISVSGLAIQATQTSGGVNTITWSVTKLA
jgi:hypothetical protein